MEIYKLILDKLSENLKIIIHYKLWITFIMWATSMIILYVMNIFIIYSQLIMIISGVTFITLCFKQFLEKRFLFKRLRRLSKDEKNFLKKYQNTKTQCCFMIDGTARGLEQDYIIYRATSLVVDNMLIYNIQPWAWDYIQDHPEFLDKD